MRVLLHSFSEPEENIACEEYFFNRLSRYALDYELLRIWESPVYFVVIGNSQRVDECVFLDECRTEEIKIIRRCSAGGAVLQGPGCLNFSIYLDLNKRTELREIRNSYKHILGRLANSINQKYSLCLEIKGICDLVYMNKKVGGNAQRRNNRILLHHGTILLNVDYELMEKTLKIPIEQPEYRMNRGHREFVGSLPITREEITKILIETFGDKFFFSELTPDEKYEINKLAKEKYSKDEWNYRR